MPLLDDIQPVQSRSMPVFLLLDTSGSMREDDKIEVLNESVAEMIASLTTVDAGHGLISLTLIAFGGDEAKVIASNEPVNSLKFSPLMARGRTPMGQAFTLAHEILENRDLLPSNAYRATIALVSDGLPVPALDGELEALISGERGKKTSRFALAIGADADKTMLAKFASNGAVHEASAAAEIRNFLQWVTYTVTQETLSKLADFITSDAISDESLVIMEQRDVF